MAFRFPSVSGIIALAVLGGCTQLGSNSLPTSATSSAAQSSEFVPSAKATFPPHYRLVDLGVDVDPLAVNDRQQVVGYIQTAFSPSYPWYWASGHATVLPLLFGDNAGGIANDINDSGTIVGYSEAGQPNFTQHAVEFHVGSATTYLGAPSGDDGSDATSISSNGNIVGIAYSDTSACGSAPMGISIATFDGQGNSAAIAGPGFAPSVNDSGTVPYTWVFTASGGCYPEIQGVAVCPNGQWCFAGYPPTNLLPWNAACGGATYAQTSDINDTGQFVGTYAFSTSMNPLPNLNTCGVAVGWTGFVSFSSPKFSGGPSNQIRMPFPLAINDRDWIAGIDAGHAAVWHDGVETDLNTIVSAPKWKLISANDINMRGFVVGVGVFNGGKHGVLLVPE